MTTAPGALAVDLGARTITGPAVPYGRSAVSGSRAFRFLPGWARYSFVPLLLDHDFSQRLGRITAIGDTAAEMAALAHLTASPRADWALSEADAGRLRFSVRFRPETAVIRPDPDDPAARLVVAAELLEISLTARPAFGSR